MKQKKRWGDRKDGQLLRKLDAMHFIMPVIYPNRCDNEAFLSECIDLTNATAYLEQKNAENPEYRYNLFQLIVTAMLKTITLRPKMNRFIVNGNTYQRNEVSAAFVVKKIFADNGGEGLAVLRTDGTQTLKDIHNAIYQQVSTCRKGSSGSTEDSMELFNRLPRFISKTAMKFVCFLDRHGWVPKSVCAEDPYYTSVVLSNIGSIGLHAGYHHLTNWGTTSAFVMVGEKKLRPFYETDGSVSMRESVDLGLTIDERLADGYYYSGSIRLLRHLLENPQLLEQPLNKEVSL